MFNTISTMIKWGLTIFSIFTLACCSQRVNKSVKSMPFNSMECTPANDYKEMMDWNKETGYDVLLAPLDSLSENSDSAIVFLRALKTQHSSILFSYFDCLSKELQQSLENKDDYVLRVKNSSPKDNRHYSLLVKDDTIRNVSSFKASYQY